MGMGQKGFVLEVISCRCGEQQLNFVVLPEVWGSLVLEASLCTWGLVCVAPLPACGVSWSVLSQLQSFTVGAN